MRFGVGDFSGQRPPGSPAGHGQLYAELLDQAEAIERADLESMWVSEHHFAEDGYMPAVLPVAAALLARTSRITIATDRLAASLHDPVRLAEDAIALDLLSGGRFVLGLSLCYRQEEFQGFGVDKASDEARLEDVARTLRDAFAGERVVVGGRTATITPRPFSSVGPRLMIASDGERGSERAARLADMLMVDPTEPWPVVDDAVERFDMARNDRTGELVLFTYGGLSERGRDAAWHEVEDGFRYMRHNYDGWMGREPTREIPPAHYRLLLGTPTEVGDQALEYRRRYGDRVHVVLRCNYPGMAATAVDKQIRLWGEAAAAARG
ncbi:MAG TPA: LLM class flavin-dependent oxidoreductase [Candidatus Dormibacteraeota bacterium]|jgi:alkanesulfonate monooxygenase SsuD/methylene tetrahydromethanopterin reductase-like flavin-dependent oxidoreductase (luciferase family)|nr:LLM class flavin-dependent oxidoreductase [Candidatus Dormibacteraeota bacterium]